VDLILSNKKSSLVATVRTHDKLAHSSNRLVIIVLDLFDYCFPENGLTAYRLGKKLASQVHKKARQARGVSTHILYMSFSRASLAGSEKKTTQSLSTFACITLPI
jgi:RNA 3'-terminal phosphate cyclase